MGIKLIAVDMDGTLMDSDHLTVPSGNVAALRKASECGIKIVIATGRNLCLLEDAARQLGVVDYVVASNGAGLVDWHTREWLGHIGLPEGQWGAILEILRRRKLAVETYADGNAYLTEGDLRQAGELGYGSAAFADFFTQNVELVDDVAAAVAGKIVEKFHVFYVPPHELAELKEELMATGPVVFANGEATNLELTAPGADKGAVLARLCASLSITPEEVMTFGDGDNDLGMLSWAGESFAMENGSEGAKRAAKHLAPRNSEAGVGQVVERYLSI